MVGIDASERNVERGRQRCQDERFDGRIRLVLADASDSGLPDAAADFIWGEDAWCYVTDKAKLVAEAARLVRPGGAIAFTDWVEGSAGLTDGEAEKFLRLMRFANIQDIDGYGRLLSERGCRVRVAEDTGRFPAYFDLFVNMIEMQLTDDVLATVGHSTELLNLVTDNFRFLGDLSRAAARSAKPASLRSAWPESMSLSGRSRRSARPKADVAPYAADWCGLVGRSARRSASTTAAAQDGARTRAETPGRVNSAPIASIRSNSDGRKAMPPDGKSCATTTVHSWPSMSARQRSTQAASASQSRGTLDQSTQV